MINLDLLQNIQKAEVPPFLLTRIQQEIENRSVNRFSPKITWSLSISMLLVLALNVIILTSTIKVNSSKGDIVSSMNLNPDNTLYK